MPTRAEWEAVGIFALFIVVMLPLGAVSGFIPKLLRTWKGKR
jgi:hypothetical protein